MKLKTKLIPIIAATSVVATVTPITLTSCGYRYTDVLNTLYQPGVTPYKKTTVYSTTTLQALYTNRVAKNQDVLRDDILYTWSTLLHDDDSKGNINKCIVYDKFNLDLHLYSEEDVVTNSSNQFEPTTQEVVVLNVESHVAGTNKMSDGEKGMYIEEGKIIDHFDFDFDVELHGVQSIVYDGNDDTYKMPKAFDGLHLMSLIFEAAYICIDLNGSYTIQGENVTHEIDHESEYLIGSDGSLSHLSPLYRMFGLTVLALPQYGVDQSKQNAVVAQSFPEIHFASHYLKDVKLVLPTP